MRALVEYDLNDLGTLVKQIAKIMQFWNRNNRNEIRIWCIYGVFLFCNGLFLPIFFLVLGFVLSHLCFTWSAICNTFLFISIFLSVSQTHTCRCRRINNDWANFILFNCFLGMVMTHVTPCAQTYICIMNSNDISSLIMGKKRFFIYLIRRLATIWVYGKSRFKFSYK